MTDFLSSFWPWFIAALTVGGFIFVFIIVFSQARQKKRKPGEKVETMGHVWDENLEELNNPLPRWWLNMFYIALAFSVVYLILFPGLGVVQGTLNWSQEGRYEQEMKQAEAKFGPLYEKFAAVDIPTLANNPEALRMGERLFSTYCTSCHGADARGGSGYPNLRDGDWLYGGAPEAIEASIKNGRSGAMPPWGGMLGHQGVVNVAEYVLSLAGRPHNETTAALGKEKFEQICAGCHLPTGKGNTAMGAPNLTDDIWLYGGSQQAIMKSIADGRQGRMPAHGEFLGDAKVHLLATYVYKLSNTRQDGAK